jgi:hypothetical protein
VASVLASLLVGWAVSYFTPGLWTEVTAAFGKKPINVEVVTDPDRIESARDTPREYLIRKPISQVGPPPSGSEPLGRWQWAHSNGGLDAYDSYVELIIRGRSSSPVTLLNLEVHVESRAPPVRGTLISYEGLGAGIDVRKVYADLDGPQPTLFHFDEDLNEVELFPLRVSQSEIEVIDVVVMTGSCDCEWTMELHYEAEGEQGSVPIDNGGEPFRTAAVADGSVRYHWWSGHWEEADVVEIDSASRECPKFFSCPA